MEVKPGYKQTDVGVIPEEWACERLSEFFSFISYGFTNPMPTVQDGVFMITAADINDGRLQLETARKTSESAYRTLLTAKSKPRQSDILLTKDGTLGRLAVVGAETICINQSVAVIRPNERVEPQFLKLLLESPRYQRRMVEDAGGSTIKHIYITIVDKMPVGLPLDKAEQRAIAEALSDVDELLNGLDRLITKRRDLKQAVMQQLLTGRTRLPEFSGEWNEMTLGELGQFLKGNGVTKDQSRSGSLRCVRYGELYTHHNNVICDFYSWISKEVASTALRLRRGDILFAGSGETKEEIGKCAALTSDLEAYAGGDIVILRPREADAVFLGYFLNTSSINQQKASRGQGDAVVHISSSALAAVRCRIPKPAEQTAIAEVLTDMDAELAVLEQRREKTRAVKRAMMQELFTGKVRLI